MRIIAGKYKGRKLESPKDNKIRPISDRLKESLFNILTHRADMDFDGCYFLDVYAGSGNVGLEALSRGANISVFIDNNIDSLLLLERNINKLDCGESSRTFRMDAQNLTLCPESLQNKFEFVFIDPPFDDNLDEKIEQTLQSLQTKNWLKKGAYIAVKLPSNFKEEIFTDFTIIKISKAGNVKIVLLNGEN